MERSWITTHAREWEQDEAAEAAREALREFSPGHGCPYPGGWTFALYKRRGPLGTPVVGAITPAGESVSITARMLQDVGLCSLEGGAMIVELLDLYHIPELLDESIMGITVHAVQLGPETVDARAAMGASDLPESGMILVRHAPKPPPGWPP